jgi:hypothetical protein
VQFLLAKASKPFVNIRFPEDRNVLNAYKKRFDQRKNANGLGIAWLALASSMVAIW